MVSTYFTCALLCRSLLPLTRKFSFQVVGINWNKYFRSSDDKTAWVNYSNRKLRAFAAWNTISKKNRRRKLFPLATKLQKERERNIRWKSNSFALALINFEINTLNTLFYCVERIGRKHARWRICGHTVCNRGEISIRLSIMEFILHMNRSTKKTNVTFCINIANCSINNDITKWSVHRSSYAYHLNSISFYLKVLVCECKVLSFSINWHFS